MNPTDELFDRLQEIWRDLSNEQRTRLVATAAAMRTRPTMKINRSSDLAVTAFADDFATRLLVHHAATEQPLTKKAFEYAFRDASIAAGRSATLTESATHPGADVVVAGVGFALKTEGARDIKEDKIHISKLMEAAWMRPCRTGAEYLAAVRRHVVPHLRRYERVMVLRSFAAARSIPASKKQAMTDVTDAKRVGVLYVLVEIPRDLLLLIEALTPEDFSARTDTGTTGAWVKTTAGERVFRLYLDGSDEKVQIQHLLIDHCIEHGRWEIPVA
jgi:hypothetical protein